MCMYKLHKIWSIPFRDCLSLFQSFILLKSETHSLFMSTFSFLQGLAKFKMKFVFTQGKRACITCYVGRLEKWSRLFETYVPLRYVISHV